jgi:hypothetical protein
VPRRNLGSIEKPAEIFLVLKIVLKMITAKGSAGRI